ncbi:MAG TPA: GNAT family protein [Actinomycetota bacterium]|nr:GNAT family protein [Actinomycetota bacterium]
MADVPQLSDGIVMLDAFTLDDVSVHLAGEDEEQARRFGWYPRRSTEATVRDAFARWEKSWEREGETRAFAMRDLMSRELVGGCEIRLQDKQVAEISYWTYPSHRQKGYATRAVRLASEFSFKQLGVA